MASIEGEGMAGVYSLSFGLLFFLLSGCGNQVLLQGQDKSSEKKSSATPVVIDREQTSSANGHDDQNPDEPPVEPTRVAGSYLVGLDCALKPDAIYCNTYDANSELFDLQQLSQAQWDLYDESGMRIGNMPSLVSDDASWQLMFAYTDAAQAKLRMELTASLNGATINVTTDVTQMEDDSAYLLPEFRDLPDGLRSGHFDLDISGEAYAVGDGDSDEHIHAYDDKNEQNGVDFFNVDDDSEYSVQSYIEDESRAFQVRIKNAHLSPGAHLLWNGKARPVLRAINMLKNKTFVLAADSSNGAGATLAQFGVLFAADALETGGLIANDTKCVQDNELGPNGEYRNGALTIQLVSADADDEAELLYEATLFHHRSDDCYGDDGFE